MRKGKKTKRETWGMFGYRFENYFFGLQNKRIKENTKNTFDLFVCLFFFVKTIKNTKFKKQKRLKRKPKMHSLCF